jgi:hypothetical protein
MQTAGEDAGQSSQAPAALGRVGGSQDKPVERPRQLLRGGLKYVNDMLNIGWIAGFAHTLDQRTFLLQQNNNLEHALRVAVDPVRYDTKRLARRPLTVQVHIRGTRDEHGPQAVAHCIGIEHPNVMDLPAQKVWLAGFGTSPDKIKLLRGMAREDFSPFDADGNLKPEYAEYVRKDAKPGDAEVLDKTVQSYVDAYKYFDDVIEASGGVVDSRLGAGQNYVAIAGFVEAAAFVPPTEHRQGYALILVRQHADADESVPVRVVGRKAQAVLNRVKEGAPIMVEGTLRRKVYPRDDDPSQIASAHTYIETPGAVAIAKFGQDMLSIPSWVGEIRKRLIDRAAQAKARRVAMAATHAVAPASSDSAIPVEEF